MRTKKTYPNIEKMDPSCCLIGKSILSMRFLSNIYKKHLKKHSITQSQLALMMALGNCKSIAQADLGRMMKLERSTISRDLKRLVDAGYLKKEGAVNRLNIEITEKGLEHLEVIIPDWEKAVAESAEILGDDGIAALDLVLTKLNQ